MPSFSYTLIIIMIWIPFGRVSTHDILMKTPPRKPNDDSITHYTLNGSVPIEYFYVDDTDKGNPTHYVYSETSIDLMIKRAEQVINQIENILKSASKTSQNSLSNLPYKLPKDQWLHYTLLKDDLKYASVSVNDRRIAVIGSASPWVESILLSLGAKQIVTLEYNLLTYKHDRLFTVAGDSIESYLSCDSQHRGTFDSIFAISSLDHDGLGRYGDRLDPYGDLNSMKQLADLLIPGGLFFLTVPVGPDITVFNLHRRYGHIRLPMLLSAGGLIELERVGFDERRFNQSVNYRQTYEPVFVLEKPLHHRSEVCPTPPKLIPKFEEL